MRVRRITTGDKVIMHLGLRRGTVRYNYVRNALVLAGVPAGISVMLMSRLYSELPLGPGNGVEWSSSLTTQHLYCIGKAVDYLMSRREGCDGAQGEETLAGVCEIIR